MNFRIDRGTRILILSLALVLLLTSCGGGGGEETSPTVPGAPTGVMATASPGSAAIGWSAVGGATSYNIYYSSTAGVTKGTGTKVAGVTSPKVVNGLTNGTTYYFVVTAINAVGESMESGQVSATPTPVPPAPTGVTAMAGNGDATIGWSAVAGATSYNIYFSTTPGVTKATGNRITGVTSPKTVTGLINYTTYYFVVTAVNAIGESPESSQVSATPNLAPPAPTNVVADAGHGDVTISWSAVAGATSYNIYFSTTPGVNKETGTKVAGVTSPKVVTGLVNGTTYYFVVTAVNMVGVEGPESSQVSATPTPAPPPPAPTGVSASAGYGEVTISWSPVVGATSYNLYYSTTSPVTKTTGIKVVGVTSPRVVTGLTIGTPYFFVVTAANSDGESGISSQDSAIPSAEYIAVGDSITEGEGDNIPSDGTGYEPILANLLSTTIANEGVGGTTSADGAASISFTMKKYPLAKYVLVQYGSNDASIFRPPVPRDVYKNNMQSIISAIKAAGKKPYLAKVPYSTLSSYDILSIQEYNGVIDELVLVVANGISVVPPDFYSWFQENPSQLADGLHPSGTGYLSMADQWFTALTTSP